MKRFHLAVVPIGRLDVTELEAAISRAAKLLRAGVEFREPLRVPQGTEDPERGQHRAATLMNKLREEVLKLKPGKIVGAEQGETRGFSPDAYVFVTDVDLYTANTEGVFAALFTARKCAIVSVRRLREAFYRRPADPARQRSRVVKELLRTAGRLQGLSECANPQCVLAPSRSVPDVDTKLERFCRVCEQKLFEGRIQI